MIIDGAADMFLITFRITTSNLFINIHNFRFKKSIIR
jgi:hypothetical protein